MRQQRRPVISSVIVCNGLQNTISLGYSFPVAGNISSLTGIFSGGIYKITLSGAITISHAGYLLLTCQQAPKYWMVFTDTLILPVIRLKYHDYFSIVKIS